MIARTTPERAAEMIHVRVKAGRSRILVGQRCVLFAFLSRVAPTRYYAPFALLDQLADRRLANSTAPEDAQTTSG